MTSSQLPPSPRVSICLPNLKTRPFLEERISTIQGQTFQDWELIVVDSYSDDGSWELFQSFAAREPRMRISQAPREGVYAGFNASIEKATGAYVYIATSDDTMYPRCLELLAQALDEHPDCDLAVCDLEGIDERGERIEPFPQMDRVKAYFGDLYTKKHIRYAPHDGLLHAVGRNAYPSVTQILIRRSLFDRIGLFETGWGAVADFEWGMRASLVANTVFVPETLATWRVHSAQATKSTTPAQYWRVEKEMVIHAFQTARKIAGGGALDRISRRKLLTMMEYRLMAQRLVEAKSPAGKLWVLAETGMRRPHVVRMFLKVKASGRDWRYPPDYEWFRENLLKYCPSPWFKVIEAET